MSWSPCEQNAKRAAIDGEKDDNQLSGTSSGEYWLISVPGEKGANDAWDKLNRATGNMSTNTKLFFPNLKVGNIDELVQLSDGLVFLERSSEKVIHKLVTCVTDLLKGDKSQIAEILSVGNKDMKTYVKQFDWECGKYKFNESLKVLSEIIGKEITQIDNDLKIKSLAYNNLKNALASMDRKTTGSLLTKDLAHLVKADDFVLNSEYLQTIVVVVPKISTKEWEKKYATFSSKVVPGSSKLITEEGDHALYTVTLFKRVIDEFKNTAREHKFTVRDFVYDEETLKAGRAEKDKLLEAKNKESVQLINWCATNFSEIYKAYVHIKALRVFVESVRRYGLPVNFQAAFIEPANGQSKNLRTELHKLYIHLDGSAAGPIDTLEDSQLLKKFGVNEYYPYVSINIRVQFVAN